jgi:L-Ala-D/L-Glu epimerase
MMDEWKIQAYTLPLRYDWHIARGTSTEKTNFVVSLTQGKYIGQGEVAPNIRFGETAQLIQDQFNAYSKNLPIHPEEMLSWLECDGHQISASLRFGLEAACYDLMTQISQKPIHALLHIPLPYPVSTMFSIPIQAPENIAIFIQQHQLHRFKILKIKIDKDLGQDILKEVLRHTHQPLVLDGNESWNDVDEYLAFEASLPIERILLIEQPLPSSQVDAYQYLKPKSRLKVFADESITSQPDWDTLQKQFHGVNVKLMKAGGLREAVSLLQEATKRQMQCMIGCMVETSLGIAAAMQLSALAQYLDLDGFLHLKDEPFGLVREENGVLIQSQTFF